MSLSSIRPSSPAITHLATLHADEQRAPRYTSYPTALAFTANFPASQLRRALRASNDDPVPPALSLYLHLPYCAAACFYCGCHRWISRSPQRHRELLGLLQQEITLLGALTASDRPVRQIHFGGGTPNLWPPADLRALLDALHAAFPQWEEPEISIEIDPRQARPGDAAAWAAMGINRVSVGVQDLDLRVQQAINRVQPAEQVATVLADLRAAGLRQINLDLILGLPWQTAASLHHSLDWVIAQQPGRIALFAYAHMPARFPAQRAIPEHALPDAAARIALQADARKQLCRAGYVDIGLDHYARPDDPLAVAQDAGRLRRNFQGYTVLDNADLLGIGPSAISDVGPCLSQNHGARAEYAACLARGELPTHRGYWRTAEDLRTGAVIEELMCLRRIDTAAWTAQYGEPFEAHFDRACARLQQLDPTQQLLRRQGAIWTATPAGRRVLRSLARCFDTHTPAH